MLPEVAPIKKNIDSHANEDEEQIEAWHTPGSTCVENGATSFLLHLVAWICDFFAMPRTPVRETLDVWPLLPIVTKVHYPTK